MNLLVHGHRIVNRHSAIDGSQCRFDRRQHRSLVLRGAHKNDEAADRILGEGHVHRSARGSIQLTFLDVVDESDDQHGSSLVTGKSDLPANRILARKILSCQGLIHDDDLCSRGIIRIGKVAAADERGTKKSSCNPVLTMRMATSLCSP